MCCPCPCAVAADWRVGDCARGAVAGLERRVCKLWVRVRWAREWRKGEERAVAVSWRQSR